MKRYFSFLTFLFVLIVSSVFSGTQPVNASESKGKISQLLSVMGTSYVAVVENGEVTSFFFQPDPPGTPDDAFYRSVLKDAYDGNTYMWEPANKKLYSKGSPWYQYDGKNYKKL